MIHELVSRDEIPEVFDVIKETEAESLKFDPRQKFKRYQYCLDKLKAGNIFDMAEVIAGLTRLSRKKSLSSQEKKLLKSARETFCETVSAVKGIPLVDAEEMLDQDLE